MVQHTIRIIIHDLETSFNAAVYVFNEMRTKTDYVPNYCYFRCDCDKKMLDHIRTSIFMKKSLTASVQWRGLFERGKEPWGSIKGGEFLD
jgi:hypothetical protein